MNASDMRDNTMGRIAIALFGEKNNRTDEECVAEIDRLRAELDAARADVVAAAGALLVDAPEPGTDMARVMLANVAMRRERDAARELLREARRLCVDHWDDALGRHVPSPLAQRIDAALKEETK